MKGALTVAFLVRLDEGESGFERQTMHELAALPSAERIAILVAVADMSTQALSRLLEMEWDMGLADDSPVAKTAVRLVRALGELTEAIEELQAVGAMKAAN